MSGASARSLLPHAHPSGDLFGQARSLTGDTYLIKYYAGHNDMCIVDLRMPGENGFAELSSKNHRSYAKHHGYKHFSLEGRMSGNLFVDPERGPLTDVYGGGLFWQELPALAWVVLQKNIDGLDTCRWMMWMDNDAIYTNFKVTMESVVRHFAETGAVSKDVILAQELTDYSSSFVNAGVFLVKNSPGGCNFLSEKKWRQGSAKTSPWCRSE